MSETRTARPYLERFCSGIRGLDIGFGGDPITPRAITIDKNPDLNPSVVCDATKLPFEDNYADWVYSSHTLEDFDDTAAVLAEWLRVLKPGGNLILFLPDEQVYVGHCQWHHVLPNQDHKHKDFNMRFVMKALEAVGGNEIIHYENPSTYNPYSFALVARKLDNCNR